MTFDVKMKSSFYLHDSISQLQHRWLITALLRLVYCIYSCGGRGLGGSRIPRRPQPGAAAQSPEVVVEAFSKESYCASSSKSSESSSMMSSSSSASDRGGLAGASTAGSSGGSMMLGGEETQWEQASSLFSSNESCTSVKRATEGNETGSETLRSHARKQTWNDKVKRDGAGKQTGSPTYPKTTNQTVEGGKHPKLTRQWRCSQRWWRGIMRKTLKTRGHSLTTGFWSLKSGQSQAPYWKAETVPTRQHAASQQTLLRQGVLL